MGDFGVCPTCHRHLVDAESAKYRTQATAAEIELESLRLMLWALANGWTCYPLNDGHGPNTWVWNDGHDLDSVDIETPRTSDLPELSPGLREILKGQRDGN